MPAAPLIPYTSRSMPSPLDPSASPPAFLPPTFAGGQRLAAADRAARGWGPGEAALGPTGYGGCVTRACGPVDCVAQLWVCACVCTSVSCVLVVAPCIACAGPAGRNGCGCAKRGLTSAGEMCSTVYASPLELLCELSHEWLYELYDKWQSVAHVYSCSGYAARGRWRNIGGTVLVC